MTAPVMTEARAFLVSGFREPDRSPARAVGLSGPRPLPGGGRVEVSAADPLSSLWPSLGWGSAEAGTVGFSCAGVGSAADVPDSGATAVVASGDADGVDTESAAGRTPSIGEPVSDCLSEESPMACAGLVSDPASAAAGAKRRPTLAAKKP